MYFVTVHLWIRQHILASYKMVNKQRKLVCYRIDINFSFLQENNGFTARLKTQPTHHFSYNSAGWCLAMQQWLHLSHSAYHYNEGIENSKCRGENASKQHMNVART